jgi:hypothetical protein
LDKTLREKLRGNIRKAVHRVIEALAQMTRKSPDQPPCARKNSTRSSGLTCIGSGIVLTMIALSILTSRAESPAGSAHIVLV